ncbi:MAG: CHAT domain-containing protein [Caldilineaceae bacterium]|jgi:CHAT domain-containing protein|nr:CHAT domain-containing protein [Caldilineaceae bacterium]
MSEPISMQAAVRLAGLPAVDALAELQGSDQLAPDTAALVARHSLAAAGNPHEAELLFALANTLHRATGEGAEVEPWLRYAQGRLALLAGDLVGAEANLAAAGRLWTALGETTSLARSGLGLTQILAMQGRFAAATTTIQTTIRALEQLDHRELEQELVLAAAQQNFATLLSYQERHAEALEVMQALRVRVEQQLAVNAGAAAQVELRALLGQLGIDAAVYQTSLDQPAEAVATLRTAIELLTQADARYDRGRAHTNLGHLYTRTGRVAEALREFNAAAIDILGTSEVDAVPERWKAADMLFLEQAIAHLSLNLLPEAAADLDRALALFEQSNQRYEWGQTIYFRALVALRENAVESARGQLEIAANFFAELDNHYWHNRVRVAQAVAVYQAGARDEAATLLATLIAEAIASGQDAALTWDLSTRSETVLLALRLALQRDDKPEARRLVDLAAGWLAAAAPTAAQALYPQLTLQVLHARGQVARAEGDLPGARRLFEAAMAALESQRAALPVEDFRTAFLTDKTAIYADLVLSLLDEPAPAENAVANAFAIVERARSRALLERLLVAVDESELVTDVARAERSAAARRQLTWLYNQLLDEGAASRAASQAITAEIRSCESTLQRIEWQLAPWLAEAEPVTLEALQAALQHTEQAIVYYRAGDEWMAFVVAADEVQLARRLCTEAEVRTALADLRFQLGRVEIGGQHIARHAGRLLRGAQKALHQLHDLLIAPLATFLHGEQLLIVPYGSLHLAPLHALWDGEHYLLEKYEVRYAPSASVELLRRQRVRPGPFSSLAAFALREPSIPQAEAEVRAAAHHFAAAQVFVDADARVEALRLGTGGDVLHFATHGLFRPDNPFFSALKLADGWVDVREIYRLPLRARLVVLSACESGAVQVQGADEAIGLVRGFLGAGAQSLVVSLWNVHDASAAQLMTDFYAQLMDRRLAPSAALREAQRHAIQSGRHPYFWASYAAIG